MKPVPLCAVSPEQVEFVQPTPDVTVQLVVPDSKPGLATRLDGGGGGGVVVDTVTDAVCDAELALLSVTVSVTEYVPAAAYVCDGFCAVEVPLSPKFHERDVIVPPVSVDVSTNETVRPETVSVKLALG